MVHGGICIAYQVDDVFGVARGNGNAEAGRQIDFVALQPESAIDAVQQLATDGDDDFARTCSRETFYEDSELVAR